MKLRIPLLTLALLMLFTVAVQAKPSVIDQYAEAVMAADTATLEKILANNYLHVSSNGCPQDKTTFLTLIKDGKKVINRMTLSDIVTSRYGNTTVATGNAHIIGKFDTAVPQGLQRVTIVTEEVDGKEKIVLFQITPVLDSKGKPTMDCDVCNIAPKATPTK